MIAIGVKGRVELDEKAHKKALEICFFGKSGMSPLKWGGAFLLSLFYSEQQPLWLYIIVAYLVLSFFRYLSAKETELSKLTREFIKQKEKEEQRALDVAERKKGSAERAKAIADRAMVGQREREEQERLEAEYLAQEQREDEEEAKELALIEAGEVQQWNSDAAKIKAIEAELDADLA